MKSYDFDLFYFLKILFFSEMKFEALISSGMVWVPVSVLILDQYLTREMILVFVLVVGKCTILSMSLGAFAT